MRMFPSRGVMRRGLHEGLSDTSSISAAAPAAVTFGLVAEKELGIIDF